MIAAEQAELAVETGAMLFDLRGQVASRIQEKLEKGDTRTILWLADRLGLVGPSALKHRELAANAYALDGDAALRQVETLEFGEEAESAEAAAPAPTVPVGALRRAELPPILTGPHLNDDETLMYHAPWSPFPCRVPKARAVNASPRFLVPDWQIEEFRRTGVLRERAIPGEDQ